MLVAKEAGMGRRRYLFSAILCVILAIGVDRCAFGARTDQQIAHAIQSAVARHPVASARVGICVRRITSGRDVFAQEADQLFGIASNTKIFTTAAALWWPGPNHEFRTALIANGKLAGNVFRGDLVVVGGGDPSFSGRSHGGDVMTIPREFAGAVKRAGIAEITGDLVMDDRLFDREHRAPGWSEAESLWWYAAPVSALSFNDNCVEVTVKGGKRVGDAAVVSIKPRIPYTSVRNRCRTVAKNKPEGVEFTRGEDGSIVAGGKIRVGSVRSESLTVADPALYLAAAIRSELAAAGIRLRGESRLVREDETALPDAREIFVWRSRLGDAVEVANRRSQNFYAEQILKTIGAAGTGIGTFESGIAGVGKFLEAAGVAEGQARLFDGSGLSPTNQATPKAIVSVLDVIYRSALRDGFYESLAVNGVQETTLRNRMGASRMKERIHAKTGTMKDRGISTLSGYAKAVDGEMFAFSILTNGFKSGRIYEARVLEDAICHAIVGVAEE